MTLNLGKVYSCTLRLFQGYRVQKMDFGQADPAGVKLLDPFPIFTVEEVHTV